MAQNNWGNYTQSEVVIVGNHLVLVSYYTPVAILLAEGGAIKTTNSFSRTTSKQISRFFNEHNINKEDVKKVNADVFVSMLQSLGFKGGLGWLEKRGY